VIKWEGCLLVWILKLLVNFISFDDNFSSNGVFHVPKVLTHGWTALLGVFHDVILLVPLQQLKERTLRLNGYWQVMSSTNRKGENCVK
jgi:hypothetical protein